MATQTLARLPLQNKTFYERTLLKRLTPNLVFLQHGQKKPMPKKEGDTIQFRKFNSLAVALTPLSEGVTPAGSDLTMSQITATVRQYGDFVQFSDVIDLIGIDPVLTETAEILGEQAGETIDTIVRDIVTAGTNVQYAGGRTSRATVTATDLLTGLEIRKAVRTLRRNKVKPLEGGYYVGIMGADTEFDLMNDPKWEDVSKYNGGKAIMEGEIGRIYGVRFKRADNTRVFTGAGATGTDVYTTMILGKDGYGVVDINNSSKPEFIVKDVGSSGTEDPLNQRSTSGWKAMLTAVRLEELAILRIEHAASK